MIFYDLLLATATQPMQVKVHHVLLFPVPILIYVLLWLHDHLAKPRSLIKKVGQDKGVGVSLCHLEHFFANRQSPEFLHILSF